MDSYTGWMTYHPEELTRSPTLLSEIPLGGYRFKRAIWHDGVRFAIDWLEWNETGGLVVTTQDGVKYTGKYQYSGGEEGFADLRLYQLSNQHVILFGNWSVGGEAGYWMFQLNPIAAPPEVEPPATKPERKVLAKAKAKPKRVAKAKAKPKLKPKPKSVSTKPGRRRR